MKFACAVLPQYKQHSKLSNSTMKVCKEAAGVSREVCMIGRSCLIIMSKNMRKLMHTLTFAALMLPRQPTFGGSTRKPLCWSLIWTRLQNATSATMMASLAHACMHGRGDRCMAQ